MNGLVLIDKPSGCTSHDVVNRWRKLAGTKRVGHLGTLDPMATGLLAIVTGTATRLATFYERQEKTYRATIKLGLLSDTYDAEGVVEATGATLPSEEDVREALGRFVGIFEQLPPPVSAKKVNGVAAYKLVRKNIPFELKPVQVEIKSLRIFDISLECIDLEVTCSAGTYIRSLAHDLGQQLGCGALLSQLRRTRVGDFSLDGAKTLEELSGLAQMGALHSAVIPPGQLLPHIPAEHVSVEVEAQVRQGRHFRTSPFVVPPGAPLVRALSSSGELVAIGKMVIPNLYHPSTVF